MRKKIFFEILFLALLLEATTFFYSYRYENHQKQYRFLACMSSFNRPVFLSGQVLRLLNQSYPVDVSVSIKGVPQDFTEKTLFKEWQTAIQSGKIRVRFDENRDQYSNFLDTVRNVNLDKYDYFCKIDDDDWYGPDYFKHLNDWLNKEEDVMLSHTRNNFIIHPGTNSARIEKNDTEFSGPSMCFSREVIQTALELERDQEKAEDFVPEVSFSLLRYRNEDSFLHRLSQFLGREQNRETPIEDLAFGWQYPSVMRPQR